MGGENVFLKAFFENPRQIGAVTQTSSFVAREMTKSINFSAARCLVEFGSGTGNMTEKILEKMSPDCVLFCFEIDKKLAARLSQNIQDHRVKIICDSAENLGKHLSKHGIEKADHIISSIPLTTLPYQTVKNILSYSFQYLQNGGHYIQVQYSLFSLRQIKYLFSSVAVSFVFFNFPPAFVYVCVKI
ncbi:MAG: methyltransferase domain-containing protein [Candidatus Moranbacteria bacterium]|nr:methyltransferase domain-containing protein [Candidatus Moranbacteria bacterium]